MVHFYQDVDGVEFDDWRGVGGVGVGIEMELIEMARVIMARIVMRLRTAPG